MTDFLDGMEQSSRQRVAQASAREPLPQLRTRAFATALPPPLRRRGPFDLIAEYKRRSPASGFLDQSDVADRVKAYARAGATAVSVVTEPSRFDGDLGHLRTAALALAPLGVPAMRKDFIVDPYQAYETRACGGGGMLLIFRLLSPALLGELLDCARELFLFVLLEAFDEHDIERAYEEILRAPRFGHGSPILLGVNCRDLRTLELRPERLVELAPLLPAQPMRVAESGIATPDDCERLASAGFDLALVGSALMTSPDPEPVMRRMLAAGRAAA